jgi:hypothetical protein
MIKTMNYWLLLVMTSSLALTGCPSEKSLDRELAKSKETLANIQVEEANSRAKYEKEVKDVNETSSSPQRYPLSEIAATEKRPRVYFYRLLLPLKDLSPANWDNVSSKYEGFPDKRTDWIVIFSDDSYELPIGTEAVEFSKTITSKEFAGLNPNVEGWRFIRLKQASLDLERWTDKDTVAESLTWNDFEHQFPSDIILESWSFDVSEPGSVFVNGVDLSGRKSDTITSGVSIHELDAKHITAIAICKDQSVIVQTDRDAIRSEMDKILKLEGEQ